MSATDHENGGENMDPTCTTEAIEHIASEPAAWVLASGLWGAINTTNKAWMALVGAFAAGVIAWAAVSGILRTPDDLEAHVARTDSTFVTHSARMDSLDLASLRRSEGSREMLRELRDEIHAVRDSVASVKKSVGDLTCVLGARAEGLQPEVVCRDPLPIVPLGP